MKTVLMAISACMTGYLVFCAVLGLSEYEAIKAITVDASDAQIELDPVKRRLKEQVDTVITEFEQDPVKRRLREQVEAGITEIERAPPEEARERKIGMPSQSGPSSQLAAEEELKKLKLKYNAMEARINSLESKLLSNTMSKKLFPYTKSLNYQQRKRILVTGGAGFVGAHLVDALMFSGHEVIVVDNFFTGRKRNVEHWIGHKNFELVHHDIVNPIYIEVDRIYHLASPASPPHYQYNPVKTIKSNTIGTMNMLGLARRVKARVLLASTSEVYGDPEIHPQHEDYWGNVNPVGPRACYDESKRVAETLMVAYKQQENVDIRIARIFNTFGERMHMNDGRVVSNFILQALQNKPITIYGNGEQTRSFQYVSDLVDGLIALMESDYSLPVNLGNPVEHTILEFAQRIKDLTGSKSEIVQKKSVVDDPRKRKPDISRANRLLGWQPKIRLDDGLNRTIQYFRRELGESGYEVRAGLVVDDNYPRLPLQYYAGIESPSQLGI